MTVDVRVGGFHGHVEGDVRLEELSNLRDELRSLHGRLEGEVVFSTLEDWIEIRFVGDRLGGVHVNARLRDSPGIGKTLRFSMPNSDQTYPPELIRALDDVLANLVGQV